MSEGTELKAKLLHELAENFALELEKTLRGRLLSVCLFGSIARGDEDLSSDIDILIIAEDLPEGLISRNLIIKNITETIKSSPQARALRKMNQSILMSPIILTPEEALKHPTIMLDIVDDGIILYDRGAFLQKILNDIKSRLRELGARKTKTRKGWYWILKPDAKLGEEVRI
jgi:predicted nucleotidyltransferase